MKITDTTIPEVKIIEPKVFYDDRGFFFESFNKKVFEKITSQSQNFIQDNHSKSSKNVLRGLHYQLPPFAQGKLVRVVQGEVFDVAVDIRKSSSSFGKWVGEKLSSENKKQLWIPEGFAHGFITLSDNVEFIYKTTNYYDKQSERSIIWNDKDLNIDWAGISNPIISSKDLEASKFADAEVFK